MRRNFIREQTLYAQREISNVNMWWKLKASVRFRAKPGIKFQRQPFLSSSQYIYSFLLTFLPFVLRRPRLLKKSLFNFLRPYWALPHFSPHTTTLAGIENLQLLWWVNHKQNQNHYQHLSVSILNYPLRFQKTDSRILTNLLAKSKLLNCEEKRKRCVISPVLKIFRGFFFLRINVI